VTDDERIERALKSIGDSYVRENPPNYPAFREGVLRRQRRRRWFQVGSAVAFAGATVAIGLFFARSAPLDRPETPPAGLVTEAITHQVGVGESPTQINVGRGAIWVTSKSGSVTKIDPATKEDSQIDVGGLPTDLAVGGSGVWIANNGLLQRLDLDTTGEVERYPIASGTARMHVSVAPGAVWVVVSGEQVFKVDPDTGKKAAFDAGLNPVDIAVGDGTLWALDQSGRIQGFDVKTGRALRDPIDVPTGDNAEITLGSDALWYGVQGSRTFVRIDVQSLRTREVTLPGDYLDMGVGKGEVWVLMAGDDDSGTFVSLDPATGDVAGPVHALAGTPVDIAVGRQALWIVNGTGHTAQRVQKSTLPI
jgi:streptogramin lyase